MDDAATYGFLEVVRYLHQNRTEGCTTLAMNGASGNGHLEVVKFLHENRTEGCTLIGLDMAVRNGYLEVVKFLNENRKEIERAEWYGTMVDVVAECGHLEVLKYICEARKDIGKKAQKMFKDFRDFNIVLYLHQHTGCDARCSPEVFNKAVEKDHVQLVKHLLQHCKNVNLLHGLEVAIQFVGDNSPTLETLLSLCLTTHSLADIKKATDAGLGYGGSLETFKHIYKTHLFPHNIHFDESTLLLATNASNFEKLFQDVHVTCCSPEVCTEKLLKRFIRDSYLPKLKLFKSWCRNWRWDDGTCLAFAAESGRWDMFDAFYSAFFKDVGDGALSHAEIGAKLGVALDAAIVQGEIVFVRKLFKGNGKYKNWGGVRCSREAVVTAMRGKNRDVLQHLRSVLGKEDPVLRRIKRNSPLPQF
jgi:hypothetical protein